MIQLLGSISSMLGLAISLYVLWRELAISKDVTALKKEEESWHKTQETQHGKVSKDSRSD